MALTGEGLPTRLLGILVLLSAVAAVVVGIVRRPRDGSDSGRLRQRRAPITPTHGVATRADGDGGRTARTDPDHGGDDGSRPTTDPPAAGDEASADAFTVAGLPVVETGKRIARQVKRDDVIGLSAELAYRSFLALFPFAIFLTALGGFVASSLPIGDPTGRIIEVMRSFMPPEAASLIGGQIRRIIESRDGALLSLSAVAALFFATGATNAIIKAMNRAYDVPEGRPIWRRYIVAIALTLVVGTSLIAAFALYLPFQVLGHRIAEALGLAGGATVALNLAAILGAFVLLVVGVAILYRVAPNIRLPVRSILPGAVVFGLGWLLGTWAFSFYVSNFGSYTATYGALAGVAVMLIWFYATGFILLLGAEVNDVIHELRDPRDMEARRAETSDRTDP